MTEGETVRCALVDLCSGTPRVQSLAENAVAQYGGPGEVTALLGILRGQPSFPTTHFATIAVRRLGRKNVPVLIHALSDPVTGVRLAALLALRGTGAEEAGPSMERCLGDPESGVRRAAMAALSTIKGRSRLSVLIGMLNDQDEGVRTEAVRQIGEIGGPEVVETLITALDDPRRDPRVEAMKALARIGDGRAIEPLIAILDRGGYRDRGAAAEALGQFRDPRAFAPLLGGLSDPHTAAAYCAALAEFGDPRAQEPIAALLDDPRKLTRRAAKDALARLEQQVERRQSGLPFLPLPTSTERMQQLGRTHEISFKAEMENRRRAAAEDYRSRVTAHGGPLSGPAQKTDWYTTAQIGQL